MANEYTDFLKFIDEALELAKPIPKYFSKFSNKIYCNHQKFAVYILMQKLKTTTRGIISILNASSDMRLYLGLTRLPVHSTIVRFVQKIRENINKVLGIRQADTVAVDATGFELESKSFYYRNIRYSDKKQKTKRYMKLSIAVDTDKQLIMNYKIRKNIRHDTIDFKEITKCLDAKRVIADKGYDSWSNRKYVINKLKAIPIIPVRMHTNFYGHIKSKRK